MTVTDEAIARMPRVATIATMPSRIESFQKVLSAIHAQVAHVFIYLDGYAEVPSFLGGFDRITVRRAEDVGNLHASSRFLCLQDCRDPVVVVSVDDDIIYPPDYVERLVQALQRRQGKAVVGVFGRVFLPPHQSYTSDAATFHFANALDRDWHVHELGTGTSAFISSYLPLNPKDWDRNDMDDIIVATEAQARGLPRIAVARAAGWLRPHSEGQADSLWTKTLADDSEQARRMRALLSLYSDRQPVRKPAKRLHGGPQPIRTRA